MCQFCCICSCVTCCLACCEFDRGITLCTRRKLVDLPPREFLQEDEYNNGCYFANIYKLLEHNPSNETYRLHMNYAMQMDNYTVRLIPHSNNKYQVWNDSSCVSGRIDIESLKKFHGDLLFPWRYLFDYFS